MNFSRHLIVSFIVAGCLVLVVGMWSVSRVSLPTPQMAQFGTPQDTYGVTTETDLYGEGERTTFIAGVRAALRDIPEKVVLEKKEVPAPTPVPAPVPLPVVPIVSQIAETPVTESISFETATTSATTTHEAHVHIYNPAL